jgi:hypothetical protein
MDLVLAPETSSTNQVQGNFNGLIGSHRAAKWNNGGCCHGDRGRNLWRVGQQQLMMCVVFLVVVCDRLLYYTHFLEQSIRTMANFAPTQDDDKATPQESNSRLNYLQNKKMI